MPARKKPDATPRRFKTEPRETIRHKFEGYDPDEPNNKHLSRFAYVWNEAGLGYEKSFRVLRRCYRKMYGDRRPLITHMHHIVYLDLCGYAWDGVMFSKEAMAAHYKIKYDTLTAIIDHLEDVRLLYRVRLVDVKDYPIQHIMMTPITEKKYLAGGCVELYEAAAERRTKKLRDQHGHNNFPLRRVKAQEIFKVCGDRQTAKKLDNIVADIVFRYRHKELDRPTFFTALNGAATRHKLEMSERLYAVAWERKLLYASEL